MILGMVGQFLAVILPVAVLVAVGPVDVLTDATGVPPGADSPGDGLRLLLFGLPLLVVLVSLSLIAVCAVVAIGSIAVSYSQRRPQTAVHLYALAGIALYPLLMSVADSLTTWAQMANLPAVLFLAAAALQQRSCRGLPRVAEADCE
jgi:hypothetical protein